MIADFTSPRVAGPGHGQLTRLPRSAEGRRYHRDMTVRAALAPMSARFPGPVGVRA